MSLVWFMLCSGFVHFTLATNRLRSFNLTGTTGHWNDSLQECKVDPFTSLVTLYDEEDINYVTYFLNVSGHEKSVWFGLHKQQPHPVATWSNGEPLKSSPLNVNLTNGMQRCGAIRNNTWADFNCSNRLSFMCYKDDDYTLIVDETRNWCEALQYCRRHYTDLVTITNDTQLQQVIDKGKDQTFWIGLMYDEWKWADNSCSTFRTWDKIDHEFKCASLDTTSPLMSGRPCEESSDTLCSKGYVRIRAISESLTWEEAYNYCEKNHSGLLRIMNREDQEAVEQRLNHTANISGPFWIGLRQSRVFGFWIWSNSTVTYSNWENGRQPELPLSDHCGVINETDFIWRDEDCSHKHPFLCEEEILLMD